MPTEDAKGHLHADAGSPAGGQFVGRQKQLLVDGLEGGALTKEEHEAVTAYTDASHWFNSTLREPETNIMEADELATLGGLDRLMARSKFPEDVTLYRGVDPKFVLSLKEGDVLFDKAFTSTSLDPMRSLGGAQMIINMPKGSHAVAIGSLSYLPSEQEVLINRGNRLVYRGWVPSVTGRNPIDYKFDLIQS